MNYFAHARRFLDDAYFVAGTAVPDWLGVVDRQVRARSQSAATLLNDPDPRVVSLARGIIQHHHDDAWFHQTGAFSALNTRFAVELRGILIGDQSMRPGFVGHVAVELLLDDWLVREAPHRLDEYYQTLDRIDAVLVEQTVNRISRKTTDRLSILVPRFALERFLYDYASNEKLLWRLNQVMRRVGLDLLPATIVDWLAHAREEVRLLRDELLEGESPLPAWQSLS